MKKILLIILVALIGVFLTSSPVGAVNCRPNDCDQPCTMGYSCKGTPPDDCTCVRNDPNLPPDNPFGEITNPISGGSLGPNGGLIALLNNVLRLVFIGSGIYAFIQVIIAGTGFMTAGGDAKKIEQAWNTIWQSLLGVIIIVSSIAIAALLGLLLFGDYKAILQPKIYGPGP